MLHVNRCADNTSGMTSGVLTVACNLMAVDEVNGTSIKDLCDFYCLDSTIVAREPSSVKPTEASTVLRIWPTCSPCCSSWTDTGNSALSDTNPATVLTNSLMIVLKKMMMEKTVTRALQSIVPWPCETSKNGQIALSSHYALFTSWPAIQVWRRCIQLWLRRPSQAVLQNGVSAECT